MVGGSGCGKSTLVRLPDRPTSRVSEVYWMAGNGCTASVWSHCVGRLRWCRKTVYCCMTLLLLGKLLSKTIDRGSRGIRFVLSGLMFNVVPTLLELSLVCGVLAATCSPAYAGLAFSAVAV